MKNFEIRWKNFRGFEDTDWITIKPITIIIGPNNSGKTSLHAPLLLLKQSALSEDLDLALKTKGDLINSGTFADIVHKHDTGREISFNLRFNPIVSVKSKSMPALGIAKPSACEVTFAVNEPSSSVILSSYKVVDIHDRLLLKRKRRKSGQYSLEEISKIVDKKRKKANTNTDFDEELIRFIRKSKPENFLFNDVPFRAALLKQQPGRNAEIELSWRSSLYLKIVNYVNSSISTLLDDISYVGPLRERPKRFYEISGEMPNDVGTKGEYAPEIIYRLKNEKLNNDVIDWLKKFDFASDIACEDLNNEAFSLSVSRDDNSTKVNFADTGFGMSQVLPLIVQGLHNTSKNGLIIAEQPEIHLNPRLQSILADLFCSIANSGTSVFIETHSEHLLLRLRRLIAQGDFNSDNMALYYVEKESGQSVIRHIPIQVNGHVDSQDWPKGFFGESLKEALGLASAQANRGQNA